jgi:hypothetical protein
LTQKNDFKKLKNIINLNKNTKFGKVHNFEEIKNYENFKKKIPISEYSYFKNYINRILENGDFKELTNLKSVNRFARSSGTTGEAKYIPMAGFGLQSLEIISICNFFFILFLIFFFNFFF